MVRVLLYGYCVGVRSSRELERVCVDMVAFRWLAAQQALELCRVAGMVSLGQVVLDGTKVGANASRPKGHELRAPDREAEGPRRRSIRTAC